MVPEIAVVRTSTANLAAVIAAFERLGRPVSLTADPSEVTEAPWVVLPGVGAFGAARRAITDAGLDEAIAARVQSGRATLGICLGMQLFGEGSSETPGVTGLSLFPGSAKRFEGATLRVPQMGWNAVAPAADCTIVPDGFAYFANSYRLTEAPVGWAPAWSDYGGPFLAAVERGSVVGCQFHPELSGRYGRALLTNWLEAPC